MKKVLLFAILLMCLGIQAQEKKVEFKLQPTGAFLTEDGKDFAVIEFEGKSASELYSMVRANVMTLYNSPKEVMSETSGELITIFAYEKNLWTVKSMGATGIYGGNYKLIFKFKDGKIRIDAPSISEEMLMTDGAFTKTIGIPERVFLSSCAKKVCKSKSKKDNQKKTYLEDVVNKPINHLLGFSQSQKQKEDEDW
jgi:hypothetical protein